jgi:hypothetical protein
MTERAHELHVRVLRGRVHLAFYPVVRGFVTSGRFRRALKGCSCPEIRRGAGHEPRSQRMMLASADYKTQTEPVPCRPIAWAAPRLRSRLTPCTNGPRSLTTTLTVFPVRGLVTLRRVPNGKVRCAAVMPRGLKGSPLAVRRPSQ